MGPNDWKPLDRALGLALAVFVLFEVNYPHLTPQSQLAFFALAGLVLCYRNRPLHRSLKGHRGLAVVDRVLAGLSALCCLYVVVQSEPVFRSLWLGGQSLGNRAGQETGLDIAVGVLGLILIVEATRRAIGAALPILAVIFLLYARFGPLLPSVLFPHRGYGIERIVAQSFLQSQGVFGTALRVMFVYVFLFVLFGAVLGRTGATRFVLDLARKLFGSSPGGAAKISVLSSGLMGSLSGSAVANTATTGTFTIPLMRESGFDAETAGGIEAAASSGGALVPPVMGAGAYMMLEIIEPRVTYLQILQAALIPAILYYLSIFLVVHFRSRRMGAEAGPREEGEVSLARFEGVVFAIGILALVLMLLLGYTVFRAATVSLVVVLVVSALHPRTRLGWRSMIEAATEAARDAVPLICASATVGIIIGIVTLTGVGTRLPSTILSLAQGGLLPALLLIMVSSIVLGMGMPSAVCYLLMATLIGPALGQLGIVPLAAHLFIFYFGMLSMVTPPVALAAYTAASISGGGVMKTGMAAFRIAFVGFLLPYLFVLRPALLMLRPDGSAASWLEVGGATLIAATGVLAFAAGLAGYLRGSLGPVGRLVAFAAALTLLFPTSFVVAGTSISWALVGCAALVALWIAGKPESQSETRTVRR